MKEDFHIISQEECFMKKCIALVLSLVLLMTCAASLADNLVEKDIQFGSLCVPRHF